MIVSETTDNMKPKRHVIGPKQHKCSPDNFYCMVLISEKYEVKNAWSFHSTPRTYSWLGA